MKDKPSSQPKCEVCESQKLNELEDWEQFVCEECKTITDVNTLQMHGDLGRVDEGILKCKYDEEEIKLKP